ncbi:hypothetical protein SLITO_v1c04190 [Spiroplasma litorale]|uniref:Transmembrane protein n=1 Tax=Spiroplasma litorale TaxID=216942 RepID=A0A0K1W1U1_9MOLU|nr:hypothetical protein [Spiroplasma litorale]AKX34072.1 hypothetical protein SLITO_v1c04190 [Spiroplasma litorale]
MNKNNKQDIKSLKKSIKEDHKNYVDGKIDEMFENPVQKLYSFRSSKKLKFYDYFIVAGLVLVSIGISFLISIYGFKNINKTEWVSAGFTIFTLLAAIVTGWVKNNYVAKFFNDKRRRYQTTLSTEEGFMRRIIKILLLTFLTLLVITIIFIFTLK